MTDWMLVLAYVQGDEGAFERLVEKYFRMVHALAVRQVGDAHLAEEVAQSVFIILARKASKLSSSVSVCGWLVQTTRFVCRDALKMRQRRQQNELELAASLDLNARTNADPNSMAAILDEALASLPAAEQAGVMAHFFEGKNFKEIGEMLAISEDGAQKRVSRSLAKLRVFLMKRGAKVTLAALAGLLTGEWANQAAAETLPAAIKAAQAAAKEGTAAGKALELADHATRLLGRRAAVSLGVKVAVAVVLIGGGWTWMESSLAPRSTFQVSDPRVETLGKDWSRMVLEFARFKQASAGMPANDPRLQQLMAQATPLMKESDRISAELGAVLTPPQDRERLAEFLTVEIGETLNLGQAKKLAFYSFCERRLAQGATLSDAKKAMVQDLPAEMVQIKAMLSPDEQKRFDTIYSADGSGFWVYLKLAPTPK
jgi:RNA polymerase sigma factor (sigma-70 family)